MSGFHNKVFCPSKYSSYFFGIVEHHPVYILKLKNILLQNVIGKKWSWSKKKTLKYFLLLLNDIFFNVWILKYLNYVFKCKQQLISKNISIFLSFRYVLEGFNSLSWLSLDPSTHDRRSCLPVHIQVLMQLYQVVEALLWSSS